MATENPKIQAIYRYPVKSMAGEQLQAVDVGWHGLDGDRRLALRCLEDHGGFPWLSAGKLPDLLLDEPNDTLDHEFERY